MAKLIYSALTSFDGSVADQYGTFDWAELDEEVHAFVNDLERTGGTNLYRPNLPESRKLARPSEPTIGPANASVFPRERTLSTSWGSLVRAQHGPPRIPFTKRDFSVSG